MCYQENGHPGCTLIQQMSTECTLVTRLGVKQILLTQQKLTTLQSEHSILALSELANEFTAKGNRRTFPLLKVSRVTIGSRSCLDRIRLAAAICKNLLIADIYIEYGYAMSNQDIVNISSLSNLHLEGISFDYGVFRAQNRTTYTAISLQNYFNGIGHLLTQFGRGLKKLEICDTLNVNMTTVLSCCPNVSTLILNANSYQVSNIPHSAIPLQQLETFSFKSLRKPPHETHYLLPGNVILFILSSPTLNHLCINICATLTDSILETAFERTKFRNLKSFHTAFCDSITNSGLDLLRSDVNAISVFSVEQCRSVDHERLSKEWATSKREKNWNVEICIQYDPDYEYEEEDDGMDADD